MHKLSSKAKIKKQCSFGRSPHGSPRTACTALSSGKNAAQRLPERFWRIRRLFDKGPSALRPLVLRQIADETELHESTVSPCVRAKYLICPLGVFELKYFFSSSVGPSDSGEAASAASVKAALKRLVDQEPKAKPLSDAKLASALEQQGFAVARRTVAKYRESLRIAPASERKISTKADVL